MRDITTYECKDGRTRVYIKGTKKVVSYPRLLLEEKIGRELLDDEQVHHIDGNPKNNSVDNLELVHRGEHQRSHNPPKYFDKTVNCAWCGKEFTWTALQQRTHKGNCNSKSTINKAFCSKSCCGSYGKHIQLINAGVAK